MKTRSGLQGLGALAAACALITLTACGGDDNDAAAPPPIPAPAPAPPAETALAGDCTTLTGLATAGMTLTAATVEAGTMVAGNTLPAHCVLRGRMNERTGADGLPYAIGFELRLPRTWNGRFMFQGGGGNDGFVANALGAVAGLNTSALGQGFAVVSTDAGHQGGNARFGLDPQARIDHAYNSYDVVTVTAKDLIQRAYGRGPDRSYFVGCSGGGRQAMLFPQRFPQHFDGIAATAPAMKVAREASVASVWNVITHTAIAPVDAGGARILSQAYSNADLKLVADAVVQRCDALDGAVDGMVHANPSACGFDPAVLQCTGAKAADCLSAEQVGALKKDFGGPRNSAGQPLYASWPWDAGIAGPDWRNWRLGTSTTAVPNARNATLIAADAMRYEFFTPPDPAFDYMAFNFDTDPARMDAYAAIYHTTSTDVGAFRNRGGKMLLVHGLGDPIFSANDTIDYYQRLQAAQGGAEATRGFARLYLVPGMNHCANSGGPATDQYDALASLVQWVEQGTAPDRIVARAGTATPWPGRTRPLCPYPQQARYDGAGDVEKAESFSCR